MHTGFPITNDRLAPEPDLASKSAFDPMYGPAVRCKSLGRDGDERSCINVSGL
jgi:hypothetical protein